VDGCDLFDGFQLDDDFNLFCDLVFRHEIFLLMNISFQDEKRCLFFAFLAS